MDWKWKHISVRRVWVEWKFCRNERGWKWNFTGTDEPNIKSAEMGLNSNVYCILKIFKIEKNGSIVFGEKKSKFWVLSQQLLHKIQVGRFFSDNHVDRTQRLTTRQINSHTAIIQFRQAFSRMLPLIRRSYSQFKIRISWLKLPIN